MNEWEIVSMSGFRIGCFPIGSIIGTIHEWLAFPKHFAGADPGFQVRGGRT